MQTLSPSSFLRVDDKFFPSFVLYDTELSQGPVLLYVVLFRLARQRDHCWPSQATLARMCKCTERSVQHYLQQLVALQYIRIERLRGHNVYRLLFSLRVRALLHQHEITLLDESAGPCPELTAYENISPASPMPSDDPKNLRMGHENISHNLRDIRTKNLPPTPLPIQHSELASPRLSSLAQGGVAFPPLSGRGDSFSPAEKNHARKKADARQSPELEAHFEQLYAAWPVKKDQDTAKRIFCSLARAGQLPLLESLLDTVKRFACEDKHWKNGCAPLLSTWLRGRRWLDEPYSPNVSPSGVNALSEALSPQSPQNRAAEPPLPVPAPPPLAVELEDTAKALAGLWPQTGAGSRGKLLAQVGLARLRGIGLDALVERARAYMRATTCPMPVNEWMSGVWT